MKKVKYFIFSLICLFSCSIVYAENEFVIKSITPVYDEASSVIVTETDDKHNVIFNDKNQSVKYNVVIENASNKDLKVESINLTNPSEDFLKYELDGLKSNDVIKANTTKEVVISLSTVKQDGWGRNFDDELTATINFVDPIANPNTGTSEVIIVILICGTLISCAFIVICRKKKITRYIVILLAFGSVITVISAKESFVLPLKINVSYESQNVMQKAYTIEEFCEDDGINGFGCGKRKRFNSFWAYKTLIKNIYIQNEVTEIENYAYQFDVTEKQNGRVMAYLVDRGDQYYDLYIQANGIIYANPDASYYFYMMESVDSINNLESLDTSNVTNMSYMFYSIGAHSRKLRFNFSFFDTSKVTDMSGMFAYAGGGDISIVKLDLSHFDTSNVTDMSDMFYGTGGKSYSVKIDVSHFDTSNVTNMSGMFANAGGYDSSFDLDLDHFDTSKVTDMTSMFYETGRFSKNFYTSITIKNPNTLAYSSMFDEVATKTGSKITVNYTSETEELVDKMIATKSSNSNVVKGVQVDLETISFTIAGTTYYAEEGMTWEKWIGSVYNTDGYYLFDGNYPTSPNHYNISGVMASDEIVKDAVYNLDSMTVPS